MDPKRSAPATALTVDAEKKAEVVTWAHARVVERSRHSISSTEPPLDFAALTRPGEFERVVQSIKQGFVQADKNHRAALDHEVARCFRVARNLIANVSRSQKIMGGRWFEHWRTHGRKSTEALRFIFLQTQPDAKRASFYYRATFKLFVEDVRIEDLPSRVSTAGGYQALADSNVRFPREKETKGETTEKAVRANRRKTFDIGDDGKQGRRFGENSVEHETNEENTEVSSSDPTLTLIATLVDEGRSFSSLSLPCLVSVVMHVSAASDNSRVVSISHVQIAE